MKDKVLKIIDDVISENSSQFSPFDFYNNDDFIVACDSEEKIKEVLEDLKSRVEKLKLDKTYIIKKKYETKICPIPISKT